MTIKHALAGLAVALGLASPVSAQTAAPVVPPVINPLASTLPGGDFTLGGVGLGMTVEEATAALAAFANGTPPREKDTGNNRVAIRDQMGAPRFAFLRTPVLEQQIRLQPGGGMDRFWVAFTTNINEARVYRIQRTLNHGTGQQTSVPELLAGLTAKYGEPSWSDPAGTEIAWVWSGGALVSASNFGTRHGAAAGTPGYCLNASGYVPEAFEFGARPSRLQDLPGCDSVILVKLQQGQRPDLASLVTFELIDIARFRQNVLDTEAWAAAELQKIIDAVGGSAPKL